MTASLEDTFVKNPRWLQSLGRSVVTDHPLGGCAIGETGRTGVVNHAGQHVPVLWYSTFVIIINYSFADLKRRIMALAEYSEIVELFVDLRRDFVPSGYFSLPCL